MAGSMEADNTMEVSAPTAERMRHIGSALASVVQGGDVLVLSGPLGAGKTTLSQGLGKGLAVDGPIVSPTFTIARELQGRGADGKPLRLVHVDAYRLGSVEYEPGQASVGRLLDELESLGLDEALEDPGEHTVVLMEWGQQMASAFAQERLEVTIDRSVSLGDDSASLSASELSSQGQRIVTIHAVGSSWIPRMERLRKAISHEHSQ
ncbi:tRNA (adenosine(37)-N6)-threonylcarbamoyltransferase complex ATPase subunit type 1 TsaE [Bombiscardovia apis]|uniref:tRNA threonylcarbamoyladenosine biosynthesis protein TsaE n=1 Tax=Bombiscardovia apis TaxID=2932182 RepID=A0ABM8BCH2_9BIFI|nr:tRNA (adenosine(37)-N6)-threonylcarbamoyltransferase complex ATPase subunit type 1 TsaE [Bombiscardovia apis]BDR54615.1 tRNA (adenosine(37)-N6)-threonylcarbamoyltransferase complex ATPase subunit type 1 TsaE [Bombiscardovia apis]